MTMAVTMAVTVAASFTANADYSDREKAPQLYASLRDNYGFSEAELVQVHSDLEQAQTLPQLISAERNSKEQTLAWDDYLRIHLTAANIAAGQDFLRAQHAWLARAELEFGVAPTVVAALLGVETKYGAYTGRVRVLDALATQGFDHPSRSRFFFDELTQYFVLCRDQSFDTVTLRGSYAGAMGTAQFMPSNYRRLALDFDGDGQRNLWSAADAIGSVANYLAHYDPARGWRRGEPLLVRARVAGEPSAELRRNLKYATYDIGELRAAGVETELRLPDDLPAGLIELERSEGREWWIALPNFYSVMAYNPRIFYAMAVAQLAEALASAGTAE